MQPGAGQPDAGDVGGFWDDALHPQPLTEETRPRNEDSAHDDSTAVRAYITIHATLIATLSTKWTPEFTWCANDR